MPSNNGATVRHATRQGKVQGFIIKVVSNPPLTPQSDIPTILGLIHDLAAFENSTDQVKTTAELLAQSICFAPSSLSPPGGEPPISATRPARCLLLIPPADPTSTLDSTSSSIPATSSSSPPVAGLALYYTNYSTWTGRPGIYLEDLFVRAAYRRRGYAGRLIGELAQMVMDMGGVRLDWSVLRWNAEAIKAYERLGAVMKPEWLGMRVEGEALVRLGGRAVSMDVQGEGNVV